jgi:hypothetical protein
MRTSPPTQEPTVPIDLIVYAIGAACIALLAFIVGCLVHDSFERSAAAGPSRAQAVGGSDEELASP